jgi:hypothetical protein
MVHMCSSGRIFFEKIPLLNLKGNWSEICWYLLKPILGESNQENEISEKHENAAGAAIDFWHAGD